MAATGRAEGPSSGYRWPVRSRMPSRSRTRGIAASWTSSCSRRNRRRTAMTPPEASPEDVRRALHAAVDGRGLPPAPAPRGEAPAGPTAARPEGLAVLALWGGHGSPGRTTLAVSLAAVLGAREDTILVDLDVS